MIAGRNRAGWWGLAMGLAVAAASAGESAAALLPLRSTASTHAAAPPAATPAVATPEALARLSEIKVQLAWLADPLAFTCPLKARAVRSTMLEVSGTVPSAETRVKVLDIARSNSKLAVLDALTVGRVSVAKVEGKTPAQISFDAGHALTEPGCQTLKDLQVRTNPDGQIILFGSTASYEDKLLASQRVRRVPGCRCVDNRMEVRSISGANGVALCAVSADGRLAIPAETHVATPVVAPKAPDRQPSPPPAATVVARPAAAPTPATVVPVSASGKPSHVDPAVIRAVYEAKPAPGFTVKPLLLQEAPHVIAPPAPIITVKCTLPEPPAMRPTTISVAVSAPEARCMVERPTACRIAPSLPEAPSQACRTVERQTASAVAPPAPEPPCIVATPIQPDASPAEEPSAEGSPVTADTVTAEAKPVIAETAMPAAEATSPNAETPRTVETPAPGSLAEWYRQRIALECSLEIESVSVTFPAPTAIAVTLRVADRAAVGRLCTAVTRIPELAPYHAKIDVEAAPQR